MYYAQSNCNQSVSEITTKTIKQLQYITSHHKLQLGTDLQDQMLLVGASNCNLDNNLVTMALGRDAHDTIGATGVLIQLQLDELQVIGYLNCKQDNNLVTTILENSSQLQLQQLNQKAMHGNHKFNWTIIQLEPKQLQLVDPQLQLGQ